MSNTYRRAGDDLDIDLSQFELRSNSRQTSTYHERYSPPPSPSDDDWLPRSTTGKRNPLPSSWVPPPGRSSYYQPSHAGNGRPPSPADSISDRMTKLMLAPRSPPRPKRKPESPYQNDPRPPSFPPASQYRSAPVERAGYTQRRSNHQIQSERSPHVRERSPTPSQSGSEPLMKHMLAPPRSPPQNRPKGMPLQLQQEIQSRRKSPPPSPAPTNTARRAMPLQLQEAIRSRRKTPPPSPKPPQPQTRHNARQRSPSPKQFQNGARGRSRSQKHYPHEYEKDYSYSHNGMQHNYQQSERGRNNHIEDTRYNRNEKTLTRNHQGRNPMNSNKSQASIPTPPPPPPPPPPPAPPSSKKPFYTMQPRQRPRNTGPPPPPLPSHFSQSRPPPNIPKQPLSAKQRSYTYNPRRMPEVVHHFAPYDPKAPATPMPDYEGEAQCVYIPKPDY